MNLKPVPVVWYETQISCPMKSSGRQVAGYTGREQVQLVWFVLDMLFVMEVQVSI